MAYNEMKFGVFAIHATKRTRLSRGVPSLAQPSEVHLLWIVRSSHQFLAATLSITAVSLLNPPASIAQSDHAHVRVAEPIPGQVRNTRHIDAAGNAVVNFENLAKQEALSGRPKPPVRALILPEVEEPAEPLSSLSPGSIQAPYSAFAASPSPSSSFMGLDDIPMVDSSYIVIPPDVGGAVGPTKIMSGLNNNYRIFNKSDGSVISTVGTATFWAPSGETALNGLTDPRTLYDPYNNRWIAVMQSVTPGAGDILVGVSQTSDPSGNWFLYRFAIGFTLDFPIVGFNKNWISVSINRYSTAGLFQRGINLVLNYPLARTGTGTGTIFTHAVNTHFCSAPCATYSPTSDTLYVATHLSSAGATYTLDMITGTPSAPVYTAGGSQTRPGGGWVQPGGQLLPQSAPNSGASSCGATPCVIETQDAQIRSAPVYRGGFIHYTQTIGLPSSGLAHTGVQWTKLDTPSGSFADGGRIEDATANSSNGGKWYAYPHIAVNSVGDFMVGYSQFSSAQHPSSGYSVHLAGDVAGTVRDPVIYKVGADYYHKDFGSGRNRWGDFSQAQVDPSDDRSLWTVQEYGETRVSTNDGGTGANGSRWSTYWANVAGPVPTVTIATGPSQSEGNSGLTPFTFAVNLSTGYSLPVTVNCQTSDGTATVAGNDYQASAGSITIPAGATSGTVTVNVVGDTNVEANETFTLTLTSATNAVIGSPSTSTGTIVNDDTYTITATAGANGSISPSGAVAVNSGADETLTIAADACYHIADVLVDGVSVGAVSTYTFTNVTANHTISAGFAPSLSVSIGDVIAIEGNVGTTGFDFPVRLSGPCTATVQATWKTADGTATVADGDYVADSSAVSFAPGATSGILTVRVNGDLTPEGQETILVNLSNPVNAGIADGQGLGTILNDDGASAVDNAALRDLSFAVEGGNPVADVVGFRLGLPASTRAELSIYDVAGRRVGHPLSGVLGAGYHTVKWHVHGGDAAAGSGVYFVRFTAEGRTFTRRFVLLR